jgi:hypothetical protein
MEERVSRSVSDAAYRQGISALLTKAGEIVPRLCAQDDDPASDEFALIVSEIDRLVLDATYSDDARARDEREALERRAAAIAASSVSDILERIARRAETLAAGIGNARRTPLPLHVMNAELLVAATLDLLHHIPADAWLQENAAWTNAGSRPDVVHVLAMFRTALQQEHAA